MRLSTSIIFTPVLACLCLSLLAGCGGGGSSAVKTPTGSATTPIISPTFPTSNQGPGVEQGAAASSGAGNTEQTTSGVNTTDTAPVSVSRIEVSPANATVEANRRLTFTAIGKDASGNPVVVPDANWKWTSSDPTVAVLTSVGGQATLSGVKAGTATITVLEGKSGVTASVPLTVTAVGAGDTSGAGGSGLGSGSSAGSGSSSGSGSGSGSSSGDGSSTGSSSASGTTASSTQVYANDFANGAGTEWSSRTVDTTPGTAKRAATKFLGQFAAGTVSLNLANLPTHTSITVEFDLFVIRTWDGNSTVAGVGPDIWDLNVDGGPTLLHTTFTNIDPANAGISGYGFAFQQAFPDNYPSGQHPYQSGSAQVNSLGYVNGALAADSVYHLKYTFPNTAAAVKFNFTSQQSQATSDESWGLKNVQVTTNP